MTVNSVMLAGTIRSLDRRCLSIIYSPKRVPELSATETMLRCQKICCSLPKMYGIGFAVPGKLQEGKRYTSDLH